MVKALLSATLFLLLACGSRDSISLPQEEDCEVEVSTFNLHEDGINVAISVEQPGEEPWRAAVGEWLDERLGGNFPGDMRNTQALVDFYGRAKADSLRAAIDNPNQEIELEYEATMTKVYETDRFVTYSLSTFIGLGGAHPASGEEGATFRKSDGRRLGWDIVRESMSMELNEIIKTSLMDYLGLTSDEELEQLLGGVNIYASPLPHTPPYLLENGVAFIYQQYELLAYAYGMPADTISYERFTPLLTQNIRTLVDEVGNE